MAKKNRLGADNWGSDGNGNIEVTKPFQDMIAGEFPDFDPYPWGRFDWVRTLILNLAVAQPLAYEYAELFRGLSEDELIALADSFALRNCDVRRASSSSSAPPDPTFAAARGVEVDNPP